LSDAENEVTIATHGGPIPAGERRQLAGQPAEPYEVALIQSHERDEAARPRAPRNRGLCVSEKHAPTITHKACPASRSRREFIAAGARPALAIFVRPDTRAVSRATISSCRARALRAQPPLDAAGVQNPAGDLLDGALGGIEPRQRVAREQRLRGAQLVLHLPLRGVAAVRAALAADLLQALRFDGQRIELGAERLQARRQSAGFQIILGERIV